MKRARVSYVDSALRNVYGRGERDVEMINKKEKKT